MDAQTVEGQALPYVLVKPDGFAAGDGCPLVVLLHGFGASMYDLAGLAPSIDDAGYVYAFPNAPHRVDFGAGAVGYSWSPGRAASSSVASPRAAAWRCATACRGRRPSPASPFCQASSATPTTCARAWPPAA